MLFWVQLEVESPRKSCLLCAQPKCSHVKINPDHQSVFVSSLLLLRFRMLDCLAGRKDPSLLYGRVLVNGSPQPHNFKCMVGYVVQVHERTFFFLQFHFNWVGHKALLFVFRSCLEVLSNLPQTSAWMFFLRTTF